MAGALCYFGEDSGASGYARIVGAEIRPTARRIDVQALLDHAPVHVAVEVGAVVRVIRFGERVRGKKSVAAPAECLAQDADAKNAVGDRQRMTGAIP